MSPLIRDLYHSQTVTQASIFLRHRGITLRHIAFGSAVLIFLWTSYHTFFSQRTSFADQLYAPSTTPPDEWTWRAQQVKAAFKHAYGGYEKYAWGKDELRPRSNTSQNNFNGWGVSIIDSLDTMWLMGLHDEFKRALLFVDQATFHLPKGVFAPLFETAIRYLGGLLSAYALSREQILLTRADDLGRMLSPAFNTSSGFPLFGVNTNSGATVGPEIGILAEIASCQLEYTYLAKETGKREYFDVADNIIKTLDRANLSDTGGMFPIPWNTRTGVPVNKHMSVGAQADSAHEYLLKQYLLTAKSDRASLEMYIKATTHILTNLFYTSPTRHLLYVTDTLPDGKTPTHTLEHLSCFLPGLLALGAHTLPLDNLASMGINLDDLAKDMNAKSKADYAKMGLYNLKDIHLWAAEGLAQTCFLTYADQQSRLGPDEIVMYHTPDPKNPYNRIVGPLWFETLDSWRKSGSRGLPPGLTQKAPVIYDRQDELKGLSKGKPSRDYVIRKTGYLLRPETLESLFILWRVTGDPQWREYGWMIFEAIERETKTESGYVSVRDVRYSPAITQDDMPSYFLAETLKYLYLLFTNEDLIPLDKYVFNTEGHPFSIFEWSEREKSAWGITP